MRVKSLLEAQSRYGLISAGVWVRESEWCGFLTLPPEIAAHLVNAATGQKMTRIYCNKDMMPALSSALGNLILRRVAHELETFDGCLMIRDVRGVKGRLSAHAYALALDFNAATNPLGGPVKLSPTFIKCFTEAGFTAGATFPRIDGMHFSFCWE